ncbi:MAG TPA: hypothetical protein VM366_17655, partial [Anaerolineae bacterium]|nr:hypothetical protein [Anaerolineae bacterium]
MKIRKNVIWLLVWAAIAGLFGVLEAQGYHLWTIAGGLTLSSALMIVSAAMAGYHLSVLGVKAAIKAQHGTPGEVDMLTGLLRVVVGVIIVAALLALFGQL